MSMSARDLWTVVHGMLLGSVFLLAFAGGLAGLWSLRPELVTTVGVRERLRRLAIGTWTMASTAGLTVITGTYIVYPWYRAKPPEGTSDLLAFPRPYLLSRPELAEWHRFGMEWKEHVGWVAPILATAVAWVVTRQGMPLAEDRQMRQLVIVLFVIAFAAAAVAGLFGAFSNKMAPTR
jgi:hypothetical protein